MGEPCSKSFKPNCASWLFEIKGNSSCGSHVKLEVRIYGLKDGLQLHVVEYVSVFLVCAIAFK